MPKMAQNRSTLDNVLAPGASIRDITLVFAPPLLLLLHIEAELVN